MTKREPYSSSAFREKDQITATFGGETSGYGWLFERGDGLHAAVLANDAYARGLADGEERAVELERALVKAHRDLNELVCVVRGECPSLLNEDSGGDAELSLSVDETLAEIKSVLEEK